VVRITGNFQQERVLHPASASLLSELFLKGWPDPSKLNNQSRQTALLLQQAKESFAKHLSARPDEIEFLGEVDLGFQLGIQGLLGKESRLVYSAIDRQKVFAVAAAEEKAGRGLNLLPVNNHNDLVRVPNSFSLPLVLASAVAMENYATQSDIRLKIKKVLIDFISNQISDVDIASNLGGLSKNLSVSIKGVEADRLLLALEDAGYAVDSGSACKSADMQPSHVLAAMGRPITGNIRLTIHKEMTEQIVVDFCQALKSSVEKLRKV